MPKIETDKVRELHSIALTLKDILKELKRFNTNYERVYSRQRGPRFVFDNKGNVVLESEEDIYGPGSDE